MDWDKVYVYLWSLTINQTSRIYARVYSSLGDGGHFGWDWPTMAAVYPNKCRLLQMIVRIHNRKMRSGT